MVVVVDASVVTGSSSHGTMDSLAGVESLDITTVHAGPAVVVVVDDAESVIATDDVITGWIELNPVEFSPPAE